MKAHQKVVREQRAQADAEENLFGHWWADLDLDLAKAEVRPISRATATNIIEKYEWLGCMPAVVTHCFGIFFSGCCGGAVCYGPDYVENLGPWAKYGYEGKLILLSRGACVHWTPPSAASKLIRASMKLLPEQFKVVTATVDWEAGEVGTIYQACGFLYAPMDHHAKYQVEGRSSRTLRAEGLVKNKAQILAAGLVPKVEHRKGRYFAFRGSRGEQKTLRKAIEHLIQPYPKRKEEPAEEVSRAETLDQPVERGGFNSRPPLQLSLFGEKP